MKTLVVLAVLVIMAVGIWRSQTMDAPPPKPPPDLSVLSKNLEQTIQKNILNAISRGKVIPGMTKYDVKQAKGFPDNVWDGEGIDAANRSIGLTELWMFNEQNGTHTFVGFGYGGIVKTVNEGIR